MAGRLHRVALEIDGAAGEPVAPDVALAQVERAVVEIDEDGAGGLDEGGGGQADAPGPGAQVEDAGVPLGLAQAGDGQLGEHLGVHARDERMAVHGEGQAAEGPLAEDIGQRLAGLIAGDHARDLLPDVVAGEEGHVARQLLAALAGGGAQDLERLHPRAGGPGRLERLLGVQE